jgi:hydrogenase nickel incorporation protein HypA/HybF
MDEVVLMQNILEAAVNSARQYGAGHIDKVKMQVGVASGLALESLERAFDVVKKGTIAKDAHIQVEYVPIICYCATCNVEFQPIDLFYECPECHQPYCEVRQGKELELASLEVS